MEDTIRETVVSEIIMTEIAEKNKIVQEAIICHHRRLAEKEPSSHI